MFQNLCAGAVGLLLINDKDEVLVSFKYEKLSSFCCWCGKISHTDKECEIWLASEGTLTLDQQEYGAWLQALPYIRGKLVLRKSQEWEMASVKLKLGNQIRQRM